MTQAQTAEASGFRLTRWFGLVALLAISVIAAASVWLLSWFVTQRMLWQEGVLTRDFVQSLMLVEKPLQRYFAAAGVEVVGEDGGIGGRGAGAGRAGTDDTEGSFEHFARMPDVLRANVYDRHRSVIWSSDPNLIGRRFGPNAELDQALAGNVVVEKKTADERKRGKDEYEALVQPAEMFVEVYVPVRDVQTNEVVGAIEFYRNPRGLMNILSQLRVYIALGAAGFGALLFVALYGLVRRADGLIQAQQRKLVETETFAVVGEMSSVVAHGIRNPVAAIRSSAELILDGLRGPRSQADDIVAAEAAQDIVEQSDRLGSWVRELLSYTRPRDGTAEPLSLAPLVRSCLQEFTRELERRRIGATTDLADDLPSVDGDSLVVGQVLRNVLANAMDAVPDGGRIAVRAEVDSQQGLLTLLVEDNGSGMTAVQSARAGIPFYTTKPQGMGVGLALARRVLERSGGRLRIDSESGRGTIVSIGLRVAHPA